MQYCTLRVPKAHDESLSVCSCSWRINDAFEVASHVRTIDLLISSGTTPTDETLTLESESPISTFLGQAIQGLSGNDGTVIKILVPAAEGYVIRSDLLEFRMYGCPLVLRATGFVEPRQHVQIFEANQRNSSVHLHRALISAVGGVMTKSTSQSSMLADMAGELENEMRNRLSLNWFSPDLIPYKRVAYVKAPYDRLSFGALKAMGIGLVVLDDPGTWLEDDNSPDAHLRELFVPFDTNPDPAFKERLRRVASDHCVDGIFSRPEHLLLQIAEVCQELGLPTAPLEAVHKGIDKYSQRLLHNDDGLAFRVSGVEDLQSHLDSSARLPDFPTVVKPCSGQASQCVTKVSTVEELFQAVVKIEGRVVGYEGSKAITQPEALIEPYISGPEIDANLVMWDGKLLFCEISDDFPSSADKDNATMADDFQETMFVYPSKLPPAEQDVLRKSLHESVLRLGLSSGVFHVEARVRNSSMHYVQRPNGVVDLVERPSSSTKQPSVFLLEVNIRPPAYMGLMTAAYTYGVDYFALWALAVVGDAARFKALSQPFLNGPQHTGALIIVSPEKGGTLMSGDPTVKLVHRRPDLMEKILMHREVYSKGDVIPAPDGPMMAYISCIMVASRNGRDSLLQTVRDVRSEWKHEIV